MNWRSESGRPHESQPPRKRSTSSSSSSRVSAVAPRRLRSAAVRKSFGDHYRALDQSRQRKRRRLHSDSRSQPRHTGWPRVAPPARRNCYTELLDVAQRSSHEVDKFREQHGIVIKGMPAPNPIQHFMEAPFSPHMLNELRRLQFQTPTPIQAQGWPLALSGINMVGIARTGSGKTLAYLLPALMHIREQPPLRRIDGPIAIILVPTRELAQQIFGIAKSFSDGNVMQCSCLSGGTSRKVQITRLQQGCELVVATPGRLIEFLKSRDISLLHCTYFVIDEADRMFAMGFQPQIERILYAMTDNPQILMFSATWPIGIDRLANKVMTAYIQVHVDSQKLIVNYTIAQHIIVCDEDDKLLKLKEILAHIYDVGDEPGKIIVFVERKQNVSKLVDFIRIFNVHCGSLHGGKSQLSREQELSDFCNGKFNILVATDLASRGLHLPGVKFIINYDFPHSVEGYVHRIGRAVRDNTEGVAFSLATKFNKNHIAALIPLLKRSNQHVSDKLVDFVYGSKHEEEQSDKEQKVEEQKVEEQKDDKQKVEEQKVEEQKIEEQREDEHDVQENENQEKDEQKVEEKDVEN